MQGQRLRDLSRLLRPRADTRSEPLPLVETLGQEAQILLSGHGAKLPATTELLRLHAPWPDECRNSDEEIHRQPLSLGDARTTIGRLYRFDTWEDVTAEGDRFVDPHFEAAADAIVSGSASVLRQLLRRQPSLARARSPFQHRATLLHYVAANGVEETRQWQTPQNAVDIARILLEAGAEPDATCSCYGDDEDTPLGLLVTSAHPASAGVQAALVEVLCAAGAEPNGRDQDGGPLWAASLFGYTPAVDALVRCGAATDNVVLAAAAGDLATVRDHFDEAGRLQPAPNWDRHRIPGRKLDTRHLLEYALIQAAYHGRLDVAEFLLSKGPDLSVREPNWNSTALGAARWAQHADLVALLTTE